ncbi:MAG: hypothetical protein ACK41U_06485 [Paracoccus sp. (in: a-proteobacteria)]|uniref:hypothetical protein n=1 Tax=Paracoccus sp. TaxID=267 RepID=UPI00391BA7D8
MDKTHILRQLADDLSGQRNRIETAFVSVGGRLTEGATLLNRLIALFDALAGALQGAEVDEATTHLEAVAHRASLLSERFGQERDDLRRLSEAVSAASLPISDLQRAVKMMSIVSINARVTAAGIAQDSDDFGVFTTDVAAISESATRTLKEFVQDYRQLVTEVAAAVSQRSRFEMAHAHTLSDLAARLTATLRALERQRIQAVEGSAETSRLSRQIVGQIGNAVMALQVGDATRQRLEHVETGLEHLAAILSGQPAFDIHLAAQDHADALTAIATLERHQLAATASDFEVEMSEARRAMSALAADAETIMSRGRGQYGSERGEASAVASLSDQLRAAVAMLRTFEAERAKIEAVAATVQQTVAVLLRHVDAVQDIESDMRMVSLNAALRCAQFGPRGASLNVIAGQLRELTGETVTAAGSAVEWLERSSRLAQSFGATSSHDGISESRQLEEGASLALALLSGLDQRLAAALSSLDADGAEVIGLLRMAAHGLDSLNSFSEAVGSSGLRLADMASDDLPDHPSEDLAAILSGLRRQCTMGAERSVHDRLFGLPVAPEVASQHRAEMSSGFMLL